MQILGPPTAGPVGNSPAFALGLDTSAIIRKIASAKEARLLPVGSVIGDLHGGLTFTDVIAAALETRSYGGWQEVQTPSGETWTVIVVNR